jgi:4-amino-4-deoxy-L-arabinose transferase-like glycosyltransferase
MGERALRAAGVAALAFAAAAYLHGLGDTFIPSIGDEPLYLQIARVTGASGRLLPLLSESGVTDTKPPLLFWQGIAAASLAGPELWWLRLPNVLLTFASAAVAGALAARITGRRAAAILAALVFLGFRSTIQHGRPFLTNAGETLFLVLPLALLPRRPAPRASLALAWGASLGVAALYKSFAVVIPGVAALGGVVLLRSGLSARVFLRRWGPSLAGAAALGLAAFALWPVLDPRPDLVWGQFVVGENAGKLRPEGYLAGLVSGPYPLWRAWLGPLSNAGILAPVVAGLAADAWRRRRELPGAELELWLHVLAFLAFYSLPSQRQENYLLPTSVALSALLASRWDAIGSGWFRLALVPLAVGGAALPILEIVASRADPGTPWPAAAGVGAAGLALLAAAGAAHLRLGRALLPVLPLVALLVLTELLSPFGRPFPPPVVDALRGRAVLFPDRFGREQELYRFMAPGADVRGYPCAASAQQCPPPAGAAPGTLVAAVRSSSGPVAGWEVLADRPRLRTRHTPAEVAAIARGELSLLADRLVRTGS